MFTASSFSGYALRAFGACLPISVAGANIAWGVLVAALLWQRPRLRAARSPLLLPLAASFVSWGIASWRGIDPAVSFHSWNREVHQLWIAILLALGVSESEDPSPGLALGFAVAAVIGIAQALSGGFAHRAHAFVHPVTFGEQSAIATIGAACFLFYAKNPSRRRAAGALGVLTGLATVLSQTRTAIIAAVIGVLAVLWASPLWRRRAAWAAPFVVAAALALGALIGRLRYGGSAGGASERAVLWSAAIEMASESPWTGVGPGNFRAAFEAQHAHLDADGNAHNLYLHHLAERGVLGLAATLWLMGLLILRPMRRALEQPDPWALWAFGTGVAFAIMNVTEVAFQTEVVWMLVWLVWLSAERRPWPGESYASWSAR